MKKLCGLFFSFSLLLLWVNFTAAQAQRFPAFTGRIAYIGIDGNVYVLSPQDQQAQAMTTDANSAGPYEWPTWSNDGRLAYFQTRVVGGNPETDIFISPDGSGPGTLTYSGAGEIFTYAYWSPQNCDQEATCRDLAVLLSNTSDRLFSVRLIRDGGSNLPDNLIGRGAPFYYSWSPDGNRMLWQRNNERVDVYDISRSALTDTLPDLPGYFQSPSWSPVDDRWLYGLLNVDRRSTDLVISGGEQVKTVASQLSGLVAFSWSPDGSYVAYVEDNGALNVVNALTSEVVTQSSGTGVYAFFWSPDSQYIAYITLATPPGSFSAKAEGRTKPAAQEITGIAWSVLDVASGSTRRYGSFIPSQQMIYLLSFFDQFSQSHRVWSPDSRYLVYGEITRDNRSVVSLLDTTQTDSLPFSIAEGEVGIWSFN